MDIRQTLINVINTLNQVDVKGRQNLDMMLGSIISLERILGDLSATAGNAANEKSTGEGGKT